GFEHETRDFLAALDDGVGGFDDRSAARGDRPGSSRAAAGDELVAVPLEQPDALERNAEALAQHLSERRGMALAVIERAGDQRHRAVRLEADATHLLARGRGHFQIAADPEPAQLAPLAALALARPKTAPVRKLHRIIEHRGEIAAIVGHAGRGRVRHFARPDMVAAADRDAV